MGAPAATAAAAATGILLRRGRGKTGEAAQPDVATSTVVVNKCLEIPAKALCPASYASFRSCRAGFEPRINRIGYMSI